MITQGVEQLTKAENVSVMVPRRNICKLIVVRDGNTKAYPISKKVAGELIAMGLAYGD